MLGVLLPDPYIWLLPKIHHSDLKVYIHDTRLESPGPHQETALLCDAAKVTTEK
jgi:hypothetical protein